MRSVHVHLETAPDKSFFVQKAANSMDLDLNKKLTHELTVDVDTETDYRVGVIVGSSGSGKSTLAEELFGTVYEDKLDPTLPIIAQFPDSYDYEARQRALSGIGLTSIPCWCRPFNTLSTGQQDRATVALRFANQEVQEQDDDKPIVVDEFTSRVDRKVAAIMAHCVQKYARKRQKRIVLVSCHSDIVDWLKPDWVIDCNTQTYTDYRDHEWSKKKLEITLRRTDKSIWKRFSKYHYLSDSVYPDNPFIYAVVYDGEVIGCQFWSNYAMKRNVLTKLHTNRTVIHPDYQSLGLGIHVINETAKVVNGKGYKLLGKFSNKAVATSMSRSDQWKLLGTELEYKSVRLGNKSRLQRKQVSKRRLYNFEYIGDSVSSWD